MKGVILAGGKGTRLAPLTEIVNKHLLPVYDRPMVMYPLETLKSLGVTDILLVSGGEHIGSFIEFLGDGSGHGVSLTYRVQTAAGGIAQALSLAKDFAQNEHIAAILGDNVFGPLKTPILNASHAHLWVKRVPNAGRFGVVMGKHIVEKPKGVTVGDAVTGLYVYPPDVFAVIDTLRPSARGELEITDVNNEYLSEGRCGLTRLGDETFWSDAGTFESLMHASEWARQLHTHIST